MVGRAGLLAAAAWLALAGLSPAASQSISDRFERLFGPPVGTGASRPERRASQERQRSARPPVAEADAAPAVEDVPVPTARPPDPAADAPSLENAGGASVDDPPDPAAPRNDAVAAPQPPPLTAPKDEADADRPDGPDNEEQRRRPAGEQEPDDQHEEEPETAEPDGSDRPPPAAASLPPAYVPPEKARTVPEPGAPAVPPSEVTPEESVEAAAAIEDAQACEAELKARGVKFTVEPSLSDGDCGVLRPIRMERLSSGLAVEPATQMLCRTGLAFDIWVSDGVVPAADEHLDGAGLRAIRHASTYVCRPRASETNISEHSRGSAIDIAAIVLEERLAVEVKAQVPGSQEDRFLAEIRRAACGPFKTVLGPGTDADHADHFHFDIAARSNGSTYCR